MESEIKVEDLETPADQAEDMRIEVSPEDLVEQKEKEIKLKTYRYQFEYIYNLMRKDDKKIPFVNGKFLDAKLSKAIKDLTIVMKNAQKYYRKRTSTTIEQAIQDSNIGNVVGIIKKRVGDEAYNIYESFIQQNPDNPNFEELAVKIDKAVEDIVDNAIEEAGFIPEKRKSERHEVGVLNFVVYAHDQKFAEENGITSEKKCVDIHFNSLFAQKTEEGKEGLDSKKLKEEMEESCQQLAEIIDMQYPDVAGVTGYSWIVGYPPFAKPVGFNKENSKISDDGYSGGSAFWGQFVGGDGKFNEKRAERFVNGEKPRFPVKFGFISREEFLKKHLGKQKK